MSANTFDRRSGNFFVGASDASAASKEPAQYICNGIADEVEINAALDALSEGRGPILQNKFQGEQWFSRAKSYWESRFFAIEDRLLSAFRYVEPHRENAKAFSYEFAGILRDSGSAFGSIADALVRGASITPRRKDGKYVFPDYRDFLRSEVSDIHRWAVELRATFPVSVIVPFEEFRSARGTPPWWDAFTKVKHQEYQEFRMGNLENSVGAMAALALVGHLMGMRPYYELFVNVGAHKEGSIELSDERRLFPRASTL